MNDPTHDTGAGQRSWKAAPDTAPENDSDYYIRHAARSRELAAQATADRARKLHLEMAADYENRAARSA